MRVGPNMFNNNMNLLHHLNGGGGRPGSSASGITAGINSQVNALIMNAARFVTDAGPMASQLRSTLANLPAVTSRITASSENTDVLRVRSFSGNTVPDVAVLVEQVAVTQLNEGEALRANDRDMPRGTFRFEIEVDGRSREISFTTDETLTNQAFQQRMAEAINQAGIGVTASVTTSTSNGVTSSALSLQSNTTGAGKDGQPRFAIRDISGNAVEATGAGNVTREGKDAIFSVNGGEQRTSASNDVDLGGGLHVTLVSESKEAVSIIPGRDSAGIQNSVRDMVNQFNALLDAARENSADIRTRALANSLERVMRRNGRALREIGVNISANGFLTIDQEKLRTAAESGAVESFLGQGGGRPTGFVGELGRIADSVRSNPLRHISPHAARAPGFNAALNAASSSNASQAASKFDAYFLDDLLGQLLNINR